MTLQGIAGICLCLVFTAEAVSGQSPTGSAVQGTGSTSTVIERTYPTGGPAPWRRVESRSQSGSREVAVETLAVPGIDGRLTPTQEIVTETDRSAPNTEQTRRDVFGFGIDGRRTLVETTESVRETLSGGATRSIRNISAPDLNGRVSVTARQMEGTQASASSVRESQSILLLPDINEPFRTTGRAENIERVVSPGQSRRESTQLVRDINGRWQSIEVIRGEAREMGNRRVEEETIEHPDMNGKLVVDERSVSRRSNANGQEQVVIETQAPYEPGSSNLVVHQRVQRTTVATTDGGRSTVEEVESRSRVNPSDPMRMTGRTVTTVRRIGADRWVTERQVFERDVNGRMRLIITDTEDGIGR